jgi:hypothetical protein
MEKYIHCGEHLERKAQRLRCTIKELRAELCRVTELNENELIFELANTLEKMGESKYVIPCFRGFVLRDEKPKEDRLAF